MFTEKWDKLLEDHHDFFLENYKKVTDEKLRVGDAPKNSHFGVDGSFKKMALD